MSKLIIAAMCFLVMGLCVSVWPQNSNNTIDDGDKTSSKEGDMITCIETAQKAADAASKVGTAAATAKEAVDVAKNLKNLNLKEKALATLDSNIIVYKNSKQSFMKIMSDVTGKVSHVLDMASDRINMWRTTEPTLIAFGHGLKKMANNGVEVFKEFKPGDLIDIDRKWERKVEGQLSDNQDYVSGMIYYMTQSASKKNRGTLIDLFLNDDMQKEMTRSDLGIKAYAEQMNVPIHRYRQIPTAAMHRAGEAIEQSGSIMAQAHDNSPIDQTMSREQADFKIIEQTLGDGKQTYEDARELSALIAQKRQAVATQTAQLQQLVATMQGDIARMVLNDMENTAMQSEDIGNSLKVISQGRKLQTLEEQMKGQ